MVFLSCNPSFFQRIHKDEPDKGKHTAWTKLVTVFELFYFSSVLISKFDFWLFNDTISNLDFQQLIFALPVFVD